MGNHADVDALVESKQKKKKNPLKETRGANRSERDKQIILV